MKTYHFLKSVSYKSLMQWDIKRLFKKGFESAYPLVPLADCVKEQNLKYDIHSLNKEVGILGVNNKGGVFDAYTEHSSKIKQKYKKMELGWIAYNPYRINVGSIGIKQEEHHNNYISPAYVVISCKELLNPEYLFLLMKTSVFNMMIRNNTTGTVRQSLSFQSLGELWIPLPTLDRQIEIVNKYNALNAQIANNNVKVVEIEQKIKTYLETELGITSTKRARKKSMYFISYKDITRYDIWNVSNSCYGNKYNHKNLKKVVTLRSGVFLPEKKQVIGNYYIYGGNGITGTHNEYCYEGKRLVIGRVGEYCGNVHLVDGKYWITDNAFKVDKITDEVSWEYLELALISLNLNQFKSISAQPSLSQTRIFSQQIPIPPMEKQNEIVSNVSLLRDQIEQLKSASITLRHQAINDFEKDIFK
ncbi:MAG: restriction endonuclease subunit S [Bacteroidales bacterium]|nr:restriction endonuclease subunit S [Bacteroidales bacterium]